MTFKEWLSAQYESGRLNQEEVEAEFDKLRTQVELESDFREAINEEFWNII